MFTIQEVIQKIKAVVKRRKTLLIIIPIFFLGLSIAALYVIEPTYESSTTILVEQDEQPLLDVYNLYSMRASYFSRPNALESFNQIIYSRSAMEMLIDSLHLGDSIKTIAQKQSLIGALKNSITTSAAEEANSFEIAFSSSDPVQARDAVALLSQFYIDMRTKVESKQSSETVEFLKTKLAEIEQMVDRQRQEVVNSTTQQIQEVAVNTEVMQNRLENISTRIQDADLAIYQTQARVDILERFLNQPEGSFSMQPLYRLSLSEIPNGEPLTALLSTYDRLSQQYTENYPGLQSTREQIVEVAARIKPAVEANLASLKSQRQDLESERQRIIQKLERSYVATQRSSGDKSNFNIYQELYAAIKKKLEQARINREMGSKTSDQFIVLDPPVISETPASPNKRLVLGAGLGLGLIISCLMVGFAEVMDTTIRSEEDLKLNKPVIAYLKDGRE
ncbi:MAG TPA: Wzz/FepE/Etk N-terminal domain-containing protein [Balneolaceae bacterium]|nr:Wzz/FepE/Etk N-terminal domain-containing protein [Balneolaceae bacterium]